jgi:hypothetical protein
MLEGFLGGVKEYLREQSQRVNAVAHPYVLVFVMSNAVKNTNVRATCKPARKFDTLTEFSADWVQVPSTSLDMTNPGLNYYKIIQKLLECVTRRRLARNYVAVVARNLPS